jgi:rRNA maturation RNase YbeY
MATLQSSTNNIIYNYIDKKPRIDRQQISTWIRKIIETELNEIEYLSYSFCSDLYLLEINRNYLNHDYFTDIITFDLSDKANTINSDIYISIDRVNENSKLMNLDKREELRRVIVHGLLHLIGYNDKTKGEKKTMRTIEDKYLKMYNAMFHVE